MSTALEKPSLEPLKSGREFKTFTVSGKAGMEMPNHISTKEAVVIIKKGSAILKIDNENQLLKTGEVIIIPAGKEHSLKLESDFKAIGIMAVDSNIEFV